LQAGPTPEPTHRGSARDKEDLEAIKYWWPNREQTEQACREAETLAFVYLISQDRKYGEAARRWLLQLAAWDPDGPTNFRLNCEAAKPLLYRPARAYDWAHDMFTAAEREQICAAMQRRGQDAWESGEIARGTGHLNSPFNSHGNRIWHKVGEAGIAFLGEIPQAENWLDYAVNKFFACYPIWADDDGGWHEGVSYWAGYMGKAVWWLHVSRTALGIDGLKKPFFAHVGDYPLSIAPPGSPNATCTAASSITNGRTAPWPTTACWWTGKARSSTPPPRMGGSSNRTFVRSSTTSWAMRPPPMARGWNGFGATRSWSSPGRQRPIRFRGSRCTTTCAPPSRRRSSSCCTG
jgi:hypothetical protein